MTVARITHISGDTLRTNEDPKARLTHEGSDVLRTNEEPKARLTHESSDVLRRNNAPKARLTMIGCDVLRPANQVLLPTADIDDGAWFPSVDAAQLYEMVDDVADDTGDYMRTNQYGNATIQLTAGETPLSKDAHVLEYTAAVPLGFANLILHVLVDGNVIASFTDSNVPTTPVTRYFVLTENQANAMSYGNVQITVQAAP